MYHDVPYGRDWTMTNLTLFYDVVEFIKESHVRVYWKFLEKPNVQVLSANG